MPTILRKNGFEVMIYTNDHHPAHVHIFKAEGEVIIFLGNAHTPPMVRENIGMNCRHERAALMLVGEHQDDFLKAWRRTHGESKNRPLGDR
jgi:hypothetical protein